MTATDGEAEQWPEPNAQPHLSPLRTAVAIVDEAFWFSPSALVVVASVIAAVEVWHVATGAPITFAFSNASLAFGLILAVGAVARRIERGEL